MFNRRIFDSFLGKYMKFSIYLIICLLISFVFLLAWSGNVIMIQVLGLLLGKFVDCVALEKCSRQNISGEFISIIPTCIGYWCRIWFAASAMYLEIPHKIQRNCNAIGPDLASRLQLHVLLFYTYFLGNCFVETSSFVSRIYEFNRRTQLAARSHIFYSQNYSM